MSRWMRSVAVLLALAIVGCPGKDSNPMPNKDKVATPEEIQAARDKLDAADRAIAEEQEFCVVATKQRLGSMGVPVKITVKDQVVFLCCDHCEKKAKADPEKTLASREANRKRARDERGRKEEK